MRVLIILLLTSISISLYGQKDNDEGNLIAVTIGVLPLIDVYQGSSYRIGIEKGLSSKSSVFVQGGGYLYNFNYRTKFSGYILRAEYKRFFSNHDTTPLGHYLAIDCFHKDQAYSRIDTIKIDSMDDYTTENRLTKSTTCINVKFGQTSGEARKLFLEYFVGLGIRIKNTMTNLQDEEYSTIDFPESQAQPFELERGLIYRPNLTLGFRIGYRIR